MKNNFEEKERVLFASIQPN